MKNAVTFFLQAESLIFVSFWWPCWDSFLTIRSIPRIKAYSKVATWKKGGLVWSSSQFLASFYQNQKLLTKIKPRQMQIQETMAVVPFWGLGFVSTAEFKVLIIPNVRITSNPKRPGTTSGDTRKLNCKWNFHNSISFVRMRRQNITHTQDIMTNTAEGATVCLMYLRLSTSTFSLILLTKSLSGIWSQFPFAPWHRFQGPMLACSQDSAL